MSAHVIRSSELGVQANQLAVIVVGLGTIGSTWLRDYSERLPGGVQVYGAANSKQFWHWPLPPEWQAQRQPSDVITRVTHEISAALVQFSHVVVLDLTASKIVSRAYPQWIGAGAHLISANKYAGSSHPEFYLQVRQALQRHQRFWFYNTTVGAGLPVQKAVRERLDCHDQIEVMEGNFSGSLSWIFQQYRPGDKLSSWLRKAADAHLTEPDPRLDLSGMDVARKLLILARDAGWQLQLADIQLQNLVPVILRNCTVAQFWQQLDVLDTEFERWRLAVHPQATQFCYIGSVRVTTTGQVIATAQLEPIDQHSPYAHLPPGNANFIIRSQQYHANPLVIQGPGAGPEVTAAGVHSDILELLKQL